MNSNKSSILFITLFFASIVLADNARFRVQILDALSAGPVKGIHVHGTFTSKFARWDNATRYSDFSAVTDEKGILSFKGETNCGRAGFRTDKTECYYGSPWVRVPYEKKGLMPFSFWQPDNLVVTLRLDRVEKPIPLFVKRVELTNFRKGIGGFDGTNSVVRFDLMKGDWLAPYGKGETADLEFKSTLVIKDKAWFMMEPRKYDWVYFYNLGTTAKCLNSDDGFAIVKPNLHAGIKIRCADMPFKTRELSLINIGRNKKYHRNGEDWNCENYKDNYSDRVISFRIRSRYDEKGNLKEAYYGKIYGDFEIQGDEKRGITSISFLYYLNPTSLDRNLEWDMKTNLCPEPGVINPPREP